MLNKTTIVRDVFHPENNEVFQHAENLTEFLPTVFGEEMPKGAHIYFQHISVASEVTPNSKEDIEALSKMEGEFFILICPQYEGLIYLVVALVVALAAYALTPTPNIPNVAQRNRAASSPNNELSSRSNQARLNSRIPDIFGQVRSTPDLIAVPYSIYQNNREIEFSLLCLSRGQLEIHDSRDSLTPIAQIDGSAVEVFAPFVSPVSGTPYYSQGDEIPETFYYVMKSNSVNGQTLKAFNADSFVGSNNVTFDASGIITRSGGPSFLEFFSDGDQISMIGASVGFTYPTVPDRSFSAHFYNYIHGGEPLRNAFGTNLQSDLEDLLAVSTHVVFGPGANVEAHETEPDLDWYTNLDGTYEIDYYELTTAPPFSVETPGCNIFLVNPTSSNPNWGILFDHDFSGSDCRLATAKPGFNLDDNYDVISVTDTQITVAPTAAWAAVYAGHAPTSPIIYKTAEAVIGPFIVSQQPNDTIIANFVALNGIYKDDGVNQYSASVEVQISVTPINIAGTPTGPALVNNYTLTGSATEQNQVGLTATIYVGTGPKSVTARRLTALDLGFNGQVVDEVKWKDLYFGYAEPDTDFGNVTVAKTKTVATTGALSLKDRKLNLLVTRQVPARISGDTFTTELFSSKNAADIISEISRDPKIGNRTAEEIDYEGIYATCEEIQTYFNSSQAQEFCYTFDKDSLTFEDTISSIAHSIFSIAYRRGSVISLSFERATDLSVLLFNHRNKVPGSETRSVKFGTSKDYDGIEFIWVNPENDGIETLIIPSDGSANKPQKIESIGIRNKNQAYFQAWRSWNKLLYQNMQVEFDSIAQGELVLNNDRVLIADNARNDEQDGEIIGYRSPMIVRTSQPLTFEDGYTYTAFFQLPDGTIQSMPVTGLEYDTSAIVLSEPTLLPLVIDDDAFAKSTFVMIRDDDEKQRVFLIAERSPGDANTHKITAINYDRRYYANDFVLYENAIITEDDEELTTESSESITVEF